MLSSFPVFVFLYQAFANLTGKFLEFHNILGVYAPKTIAIIPESIIME